MSLPAKAGTATIAKVLDNEKLRTELIAAGKKWVKRYSWETFAKENLAVYKSLLKS